jgi:hypothetical protein
MKGSPGLGCQEKTAGTGVPGRGCQDRASRTGLIRQEMTCSMDMDKHHGHKALKCSKDKQH